MQVNRAESLAEDLYDEHAKRLWRALFAFTGDAEIASDALSEAFAQYLHREGGQQLRSPGGWLWTAAFKIAAGALKERGRIVQLEEGPSYEMPEQLWELTAALARVPPRQRAALILHYYADLPTKEIAAILGVAQATVTVQLSQGRRRLRHLLEDEDARPS
jgi:RNA polymerase sigma-70 factor (ECF subfamily)